MSTAFSTTSRTSRPAIGGRRDELSRPYHKGDITPPRGGRPCRSGVLTVYADLKVFWRWYELAPAQGSQIAQKRTIEVTRCGALGTGRLR